MSSHLSSMILTSQMWTDLNGFTNCHDVKGTLGMPSELCLIVPDPPFLRYKRTVSLLSTADQQLPTLERAALTLSPELFLDTSVNSSVLSPYQVAIYHI